MSVEKSPLNKAPNGAELIQHTASIYGESVTDDITALKQEGREVKTGNCYSFNGISHQLEWSILGYTNLYLTAINPIDDSLIEITLVGVADVYTYFPLSSIKIYNIKLFTANTYTENEARDVDDLSANQISWHPAQETSGANSYDITDNENHAVILNLTSPFHSSDIGVLKSWPNDFGYTDNAGVIIPAKYNSLTEDAEGNQLEYFGKVQYTPKIINQPCLTSDGTQILRFTDLTGITIVSSEGTSTPTKSGNDINLTAGTIWNLILSDGTEIHLLEGDGAIAYDATGNGNDATIINLVASNWTDNTQDTDLRNALLGYNLSGAVRIPVKQSNVYEDVLGAIASHPNVGGRKLLEGIDLLLNPNGAPALSNAGIDSSVIINDNSHVPDNLLQRELLSKDLALYDFPPFLPQGYWGSRDSEFVTFINEEDFTITDNGLPTSVVTRINSTNSFNSGATSNKVIQTEGFVQWELGYFNSAVGLNTGMPDYNNNLLYNILVLRGNTNLVISTWDGISASRTIEDDINVGITEGDLARIRIMDGIYNVEYSTDGGDSWGFVYSGDVPVAGDLYLVTTNFDINQNACYSAWISGDLAENTYLL